MAKKKQSKAYQKEKQQQRAQKSAQRRRKQTTRRPISSSASRQAPVVVGEGDLNQFMMILLTSEALADEPEFKEILIDPMICTQAWMEAIAGKGINPEDFGELPEDEQEDFKLDVMEAIVQRVLTPPLRQQIVKAAAALQSRFDRAGNIPGFMQASAVHIFLDTNKKGQDWAMVGLIQALVHRSLDIAFALDQVLGDDPSDFQNNSEREKILSGILEKYPAFSHLVEKEVDKMWNTGLDAVFDGEWQFEIFSVDELEGAVDAFQALVPDSDSELEVEITSQLLPTLTNYLRGILTPDRLKQMVNHLDKLKQTAKDEQLAFCTLLREDLQGDDPLDFLMPTLRKIFLGELMAAGMLVVKGEE